MTEAEFDILDELYFIKSFEELSVVFQGAPFDLEMELWQLIAKGWVKVIDDKDHEVAVEEGNYSQDKHRWRFNATRQGLLAHNQV